MYGIYIAGIPFPLSWPYIDPKHPSTKRARKYHYQVHYGQRHDQYWRELVPDRFFRLMLARVGRFSLSVASFWWRYLKKMISEPVLTEQVRNFTIPTPTSINFSSVVAAYNDVRSDITPTQWAVFKYDDHTILHSASGESFEVFKDQFGDTERCYGYIRIQTGDEMSKRTKFVLVTWVGPEVGVMDRAKITNDKSIVKQVITSYAIEFQLEASSDLDEQLFRSELLKIGGTCYGTGIRKDITV